MNLIVQGPEVASADLDTLAGMTGASGIERLSGTAWRLRDAQRRDGVAERCAAARLDHAFVPPGRRLAAMGLAVMDMDSTLITIECIDEIADMQGLKPQVAAITAAAMRGELDFAQALRRRVSLLAGLEEAALLRVYEERLRLSPGAEQMLAAFRGAGVKTLLVSGGFTFFTERLRARLGLDRAVSNVLEIENGRLTGRVLGDIVDARGKANALLRMREELGVPPAGVLGIGDGANDLAFMAEAAVSVAYHAKPVVQQSATHALNHVGLEGVLHLFE